MARQLNEPKCSMCDEEGDTFCRGCSKDFCLDHLNEHRQFLHEQLGLIQNDFNQFRQNVMDIKNQSEKHPLIKQIDRWEKESILKIQEKANQCRQRLINFTNQSIVQIEIQLNETNQQLSSSGKQKKNFNEIHLNNFREKLKELNQKLDQPENLSIEQIPNSFISDISIRALSESKFHFFSKIFERKTKF